MLVVRERGAVEVPAAGVGQILDNSGEHGIATAVALQKRDRLTLIKATHGRRLMHPCNSAADLAERRTGESRVNLGHMDPVGRLGYRLTRELEPAADILEVHDWSEAQRRGLCR